MSDQFTRLNHDQAHATRFDAQLTVLLSVGSVCPPKIALQTPTVTELVVLHC